TFEGGYIPVEKRTESDRWILSKLNTLIKSVDEAYNQYEPTRAARLVQDFVTDDLSNWYVRLNRKRFWKGEYNEDKKIAYQSLYECLEKIAIISAPIAPFYSESLFKSLNEVSKRSESASVHLVDFPEVNQQVIDLQLEQRMSLAQQISSLTHSLRKSQKIKVRQPLQRILVPVLNPEIKKQIAAVEDLILSEVNVKEVEYLDDASGVL
ncbi:isoleucine--tRNA ligase, partial [Marivirga lumbricoides]